MRHQHGIKILCRVLRVNRSTYYKHFFSAPAARTEENQRLRKVILEIYSAHDKRPGPVKMCYLLSRDYGIKISTGRAYRLMSSMDLPKLAGKKLKTQGKSDDSEGCVNHLQKQFQQKAPDLVWVSDITYIRAGSRFYYLCVILDLFSRKIISYSISGRADAELVRQTFLKAYYKRQPKGLMFHSDRGSQYTAFSFRKLLDQYNVVQSFSKKGHPYDNAVVECFFKYLKHENTNRKNYQNLKELELSIFEYIEGYYNSIRPHGSIGLLTPNQAEINFHKQARACL